MAEVENDVGWSKYSSYALKVDPDQDNKAINIILCKFQRPHMRAFHFSWMCFFTSFFIWSTIPRLLGEWWIPLDLSGKETLDSYYASVSGTILLRLVSGPLCDKYGARLPMGLILIGTSIPLACTGLVNSARGLIAIRFFTGWAGSTFVVCQFWTSSMFRKEIVGTANGFVSGWGSLGGIVSDGVMKSFLFPFFDTRMSDEMAWRTVCLVPAALGVVMGVLCLLFSDDAPRGNYTELKKNGAMPSNISAFESFLKGVLNFNTWWLFLQYACCLGVQGAMYSAAFTYFIKEFDMTLKSANAIFSLLECMKLFTRGLGGFISDKCNRRYGMRGRLWWQTICLLLEGLMVIAFAHTTSLGFAIGELVISFSFVEAAKGSTFGIVPYVNPSSSTGSIIGIVAAGETIGSILSNIAFVRQLSDYNALIFMGCVAMLSSFVSCFIRIEGYDGLVVCCGKDSSNGDIEVDEGVALTTLTRNHDMV